MMSERAGTNLNFAPGETNISFERFSPSVVLFWLRAEMAVTNRRIVLRYPNTLLGVIPLGYRDAAFPINNVASVGAAVKFSLGRAILGLILFIAGLSLLKSAAVVGIIVFLIGLSMLLNSLSAALDVQNNAGGHNAFGVSVLQKKKLEAFREEINQRLFADQEALRHNEVMGAHNLNMVVQNQQLQAMQMQSQLNQQNQQHQQPQQHPQYQIGDIVNGHRFDGTAWVPVATPPPPPPPPGTGISQPPPPPA
jgi:hypothetical protein